MERVKIEILSLIKHDGQEYLAEEVRKVAPDLARYFCKNGWARDLSGQIATGEPDTKPKTLTVGSAEHGSTSTHP